MSRSNVYRDGRLHVCRQMCSTCIFRPGNLMRLQPGRLAGMVKDVKDTDGGHVVCHQTLGDGRDNAICRGSFDRYPSPLLRLAMAMEVVEEVDPEEHHD